jgi:hypothetical protein
MSKPIPIIQFFRGSQPWLALSLKQAERFNQKVVLIGDRSNQTLTAHHFNYTDYNQEFQSFTEVYEHLSTNSVDFELYCFQRFFVLQQWMLKHHEERVFMVDSDLLLYADLTDRLYRKYLQGYEAALCIPQLQSQESEYSWTASPHVSFWTHSAIQSFTQSCLETYRSRKALLHQKYEHHQTMNQPGGICDMSLLYLWAKNNQTVFNLLELKDGEAIDHNINSKDGLWKNQHQLKSGIKSIYFRQGLPYEQETHQQYLGLHFQGTAKPLMAIFVEDHPQGWIRHLFYAFPKPTRFLLRVRQKFLKLKPLSTVLFQ